MDWFAQADFWSRFYDFMFPPASFEQAAAQIDDLIERAGITAGAVLDLGCGPGRFSIPLSHAGFAVTGVDLQPFLLAEARAYAAREQAAVAFVEADMRTFRRPEAFDLVINMYSSFGYFDDPEDDRRVLANAYASLRPGGVLVIDLRSKELGAQHFAETLSTEMPDGALIVQRTRISDGWSRSITTWTYVEGGHAASYEVAVNLYSGAELRALLQAVGFGAVRLYGDLQGAPYDHRARRLVVVATKP